MIEKRLRNAKLNLGVCVPPVLLVGRAEAAPRRRLLPRPGGGAGERRDGPRDGAAAGGGRRRSLALRAPRGHRRAGQTRWPKRILCQKLCRVGVVVTD